MAITATERIRLARALNRLKPGGTAEENQRKIRAVIGHLEPDEADEVLKLARAMNDANAARTKAAWEKQQAEHAKWEEFFKIRQALFEEYPPGTTWGEIMRSLPPDRRKAIESRGKGFRLVRTGKG